MGKKKGFLNILENLVIIFSELGLHKSRIWEKSVSRDMDQNALCHSGYRIFKSTISLEQDDEKACFFACRYRFIEIRS